MRKPNGYWNDYDRCYTEAKKYKSRSEFRKNCYQAWKVSYKNNWIKDYVWFQKPVRNKRWTQESCYNEAMKYKSSSEFRKKCYGGWSVASKNKWMKDYFWFTRPRRYTEDICKQEALKYSSLSDFMKNNLNFYNASIRYKWIENFTWLKRAQKSKGFWDKERCFNEAKKYKTHREFQKECPSAYNNAWKNGWLKDYIWLPVFSSRVKWNYDTCLEESKKYKTRTEFKRENGAAYNVANKHKWLDDYVWLENVTNSEKQDTVYAYEFKELNSVYVGRTLKYRKKLRDREHLYDRKDSVCKFAYENNIKVPEPIYLEEGITVKEGVKREQYWIDTYKNNGWVLINKNKGGSVGGLGSGKWNYETCYEEAKKYTRIKDFSEKSPGAYDAAVRNGWRDDYTWLPKDKIWSYEELYELAKQYDYKTDFRTDFCGAYGTALKKGWINDYDWFLDGMKRTGEKNRKWNYDTCKEESKKYKTIGEFGTKSQRAYAVALHNGWIKDYDWLGGRFRWTYELCKEEALKYTSSSEFRKNNKKAYNAAIKNKWLDSFDWLERKTPKK